PGFARHFRVFTYDRRGHSQSERLPTQGTIDEDVADLAALIATNGLVPAHVVGNSFGAALTLKIAAAQPHLFASATSHEPPLICMLGDHHALAVVRERIRAVLETLKAGDLEPAARQFVENVAPWTGDVGEIVGRDATDIRVQCADVVGRDE